MACLFTFLSQLMFFREKKVKRVQVRVGGLDLEETQIRCYSTCPVSSSPAENMWRRSCTVELNNSCGFYALSDPRLFMVSGWCEVPPPLHIEKRSKASVIFTKTSGTATGSVGIFTYNLSHNTHKAYNAVLAVMYSVPFDYNLYSNWCAVGIFYRGIECDYDLYDLMYNGAEASFVRVQGGDLKKSYQGEVVEVSTSISNSSRAVLWVDIKDVQ